MKEFVCGIAELADPRGKLPQKQSEGRIVSEWGVLVVCNFISRLFNSSTKSQRTAVDSSSKPQVLEALDCADLRFAVANSYESLRTRTLMSIEVHNPDNLCFRNTILCECGHKCIACCGACGFYKNSETKNDPSPSRSYSG